MIKQSVLFSGQSRFRKFSALALAALFLLTCSAVFTSCGDDDGDEPSASSLVGTWKAQDGATIYLVYEFEEDGSGSTYLIDYSGYHYIYRYYFDAYKIKDGHLMTHRVDDETGDWEDEGAIRLFDDHFSLTYENGTCDDYYKDPSK